MKSGVSVQATGVHRRFGAKIVLNDLSFEAAPGEFVVIVGRSGCGKSTLLRAFAGLDSPDRGSISIGGEKLSGLCASARVMFQDGRLLPWMRVGDNVGLGLSNQSRARILEFLDRVGLADRIDDWPSILSGGQKQRVALARALAAEPGLLLLDEPLGSLDALTRLDMQRLIESLWRQVGSTAILVTHDVDEAITLGDRIIHLAHGRTADEWRVDLPRPRNRASKAFTSLAQTILSSVMDGEAVASQALTGAGTRS
jgi:sulfonate transport system ATP-binding protein